MTGQMNSPKTAQDRPAEYTIIGAGPAGMAAAIRLSQAGKRVTLIDLAASPGGQIYRQLAQPGPAAHLLGKDYLRGKDLIARFLAAPITYLPNHRVFWLEQQPIGFQLGVRSQGATHTVTTEKLIIATGAMERPMPFRGWQLPGVMSAGAAQILIKQSGLIPDRAPVLAGTGPLLYLLAYQLLKAGQPPLAVLDMAPRGAFLQPFKTPKRSWHGRNYLTKGVVLMAALRLAGVKLINGVSGLEAVGKSQLSGVQYRRNNHLHSLPCQSLLVHTGVVPEPQTARALGVQYHWHDSQLAFLPARDRDNFTVADKLWMIGDCASIQGAINAEMEGTLVAQQVLDEDTKTVQKNLYRRAKENAIRPLLEAMFRPPERWLVQQPDNTLICRCEAVSLGQLKQAMADGARTADQLKTFTRCGMGACQGRMCALAVSALLAEQHQRSPDAAGYFRIRTPITPITLAELGDLHRVKN